MDSGLAGQGILVTGASGGIGTATARRLAAEGARLVLHYHRNRAAAEALATELGPEHLALGADLRDEAQAEALFAQALAQLPRLDGLVVNAGIWPAADEPLHRMSMARWQDTLAADLTSAFLCCRAFLRHLAEVPRREAAIVLIGSTAALFGEAGHADYAAAKAGLAYGLTRTLKNEIAGLAPRGRVNCICPGWVNTRMAAGAADDPAVIGRVTATMALRKIARPEDVAASIAFLLSDRLAGHLSGTILPLAGGMEGRLLWPEGPYAS
ncbi:MAG: SDR family oxidoreductase [Chloroflexi bacterium]|nr:SDR family oxidoreductase [Chloroflexota bacterium]